MVTVSSPNDGFSYLSRNMLHIKVIQKYNTKVVVDSLLPSIYISHPAVRPAQPKNEFGSTGTAA